MIKPLGAALVALAALLLGAAPSLADTSSPAILASVEAGSVDITALGVRGDGVTDDTAAMQQAINGAAEGTTLRFPAGTYLQSDVITVGRTGVRLQGAPGATIQATSASRVAIVLRGTGTAVAGLTLTAPAATARLGSLEHHRIVLDGGSGQSVEDNHVIGGPAAGIFAFGATGFTISGNVVEDTMADGIHLTHGSRLGTVSSNAVRHPGDDCVAVVSYRADGAIVTGILEHDNRCSDSYNARGFSVVGGQDITIRDGRIDGTRAAAIYLASEGSYDTFAAQRIQVLDNHITGANTDPSVDHAAIFSFGRPGSVTLGTSAVSLQNEDLLISGNTIDGTASASPSGTAGRIGVVLKNAEHRRVLITGQTMTGAPAAPTIEASGAAADQYRTSANTFNGSALAEAGTATPPTPPALAPATAPSTTVPSSTVPSSTVPSSTVPSTTVPSTTVPSTTVPSTTVPPSPTPATEDGSRYTAVTPTRVLDTRTDGGPLAALQPRSVALRGRAGVSDQATAVVLNATVVDPTDPTFLAVYPSGVAFPGASSLNAEAGDTVPNLVTSPLGADGAVAVVNGAGRAHVVLDLVGYYAPTGGGGFHPLSPVRVTDTRTSGGPLTADEARAVDFGAVAGIDRAHLRAVALNVTATGSTTGGYLAVYPAGGARPLASNLNFSAHQTVPNAVVVGTGGGRAVVYNAQGTTDVIIDVVGWYDDGTVADGLTFHEINPARILDTRDGAPVGAGAERSWLLSSQATVPAKARALALNVTVTRATGLGFVTVFPSGPRPEASTQNTSPGLTRANHALASLSSSGALTAYNSTATTHLIYDMVGWFG